MTTENLSDVGAVTELQAIAEGLQNVQICKERNERQRHVPLRPSTPNDQYLCIVVARGSKGSDNKIYLPFEGDSMMSVILSKAFLLADDKKITDKTILSQIKP